LDLPVFHDALEAVADIPNGATIMVGGFGSAGQPIGLMRAIVERGRQGLRGLTVIGNSPGRRGPRPSFAMFFEQPGLVAYWRGSFGVVPPLGTKHPFEERHDAGDLEAEVMPQGTLAERIRAGGAGIGGFYVRTGVGTPFAEGKEIRRIGDHDYVFETPLRADYALVRAHLADSYGNLVYRRAQRNFNPMMAMAADTVIAEVDEVVPVGKLDNERIETPGLLISRLYVTRREAAP
jgi:3-oxoadipate CoA-transferase alpha subunit